MVSVTNVGAQGAPGHGAQRPDRTAASDHDRREARRPGVLSRLAEVPTGRLCFVEAASPIGVGAPGPLPAAAPVGCHRSGDPRANRPGRAEVMMSELEHVNGLEILAAKDCLRLL